MIRYVVAVLLAAALVAASIPAVESAATARGESIVESNVVEIEVAAETLLEDERLPPNGMLGPQRAVELSFPSASLTAAPVRHLELERVDDENVTIARYRVGGGSMQTVTVDAPIVDESMGSPIELGRPTGDVTYVLLLQRDPNDHDRPVVVLTRTSR
ncbi:DUF7311 family protein [Halapricum hydrolyticum]|uniref:DUF7311 domain-containing protein n=1 Tax=Halapricum hydrolyticum TaxID=2979991 RepID=A0AAE3IAU7_9EURY|nr:hypothetical protein [Halapricum hydrolyticum]MCU4717568.1 hypothetical protein [Halapricum hydrolyticum]MCU4726732.1 hypothetical protein [Halapricum hydrolyticum]